MAFIGKKTYAITATVVATSAKELPELAQIRAQGVQPQIQVYASGGPVVFKLGGSGVAASKTETSDALPEDNQHIPEGPVMIYGTRATDTHISLISFDGASTPEVVVTVGYGEKI